MSSETKSIRVGQIVKNVKDGKTYRQLILNKEFLANAPELINLAYLDKQGGRRFSLYEPFEGAPEFVEFNVVLKQPK